MIKNVSLNTDLCFRVIFFLLFTVVMSITVSGQEVWTIKQFLDFERNDKILPFEDNIHFINNKAKGMPFVENYEFRTETDQMELENQRFQFRLKFNSKDERKAYDKILMANKDRYFWLQAQYRLEEIEERYGNIIDLYFMQREEILLNREFELLQDKKIVLKKLLDSQVQIEVEGWISNENEIFNLRLDSIELEMQKKEIAQKIFGQERALPVLENSNFIQIETLKKRVADILKSDSKNPDEEMSKAEVNLADAEYQLEIAEGNKWLNFAQVEYQSDDKISFQREIGIGTSITIPSKRNNRVKKDDAALELIESTYKHKIEEEEYRRDLRLEESKLKGLFNQLENLKILIEDQKLDSMFKDFADQKIVSPLVLIGLKQSILKNNRKLQNLEKDIYESYINLLVLKAAFINQPEINYLSE